MHACRFCFVCSQIRTIAIIAEGIPENLTRKLIQIANERGVTIIGPATVSRLHTPSLFITVLKNLMVRFQANNMII